MIKLNLMKTGRMIARMTAIVLLAASPAAAQDAGFPEGLWQVRIFTPVPTPELKNDEQVFQVCYDKAAVKSRMNPVLPAAQAGKCKREFTDMGDLAFDAMCNDGDHRLRISEAAEGLWRGTYRFVGKEGGVMLEPAVELKRIGKTCS